MNEFGEVRYRSTPEIDEQERLCKEQLSAIKAEYERLAAPYVKRLVELQMLKPPVYFINPHKVDDAE